jgi:hypothetical protein
MFLISCPKASLKNGEIYTTSTSEPEKELKQSFMNCYTHCCLNKTFRTEHRFTEERV